MSTHARARRRRRALLTAVDFTRGQSAQCLADRLEMGHCSVRQYLAAMEQEGLVIAEPRRPVLWWRTDPSEERPHHQHAAPAASLDGQLLSSPGHP